MLKKSERSRTKSGAYAFGEAEFEHIVKDCWDKTRGFDLRWALTLAYVLGRGDAKRDQEKERKAS